MCWEGFDCKIYAAVLSFQGTPELAFMKLYEKRSTVMNRLRSIGTYFVVMNTIKLQAIEKWGIFVQKICLEFFTYLSVYW